MLQFLGIMRVRRASNGRAKRVFHHPLALTNPHPLYQRGHVMANDQSTTVAPAVEYRDLAPFGFPGYRVGSDGSVWSRRLRGCGVIGGNWKPLASQLANTYGHRKVGLQINRVISIKLVHRLVLEAFVGPCPADMECRHLNGNPADNRLENLAWGTHRQNQADRIAHGTLPFGVTHPLAKLTEEQVRAIRAEYAAGGITQPALGAKYGVSGSTIGDIVRRETWGHLK